MDRIIKVLIAESDAAEREKLRNLLADETDIEVVGEARDGKECLDLTVKLRPQIVLVRRDLPVISGLDVAEQIASEMPASAAILILSGNEEEDVWHKMLRAGIRDFVSRPIAPEQLLEEVRRVATAQSEATQKGGAEEGGAAAETARARVVAVTGPRGGCGKSVLATNLAVGLATHSDKVALVDLNLWGGDIAMLLDLTPRRTLGDLLPGFGGIDHDVVDSVIVKHSSGVSVLSAPLAGTFDGTTLSRYMVQSIIDALRDNYDCTLVDTGYANLESTLAAMDAADIILVVVGTDLPRLRDGKHYLKNLMAANYPKEKIRVVVNRTTNSREISPSEIESILEFPVTARIPNDENVVSTSVNLGQPFVASSAQRAVSRAVLNLGAELVPWAEGTRRKTAARWFSFLH